MSISAKYFAHADFVTEKCTAYNKIPQPKKINDGSQSIKFDTFCAVALTTSDSSPIMIEIGDCFSYLIFIGCTKPKENNTASSLQLLFIKSSWLKSCPPDSEGIAVMRTVDRKNFLNCYYLLYNLTYFIFSQHIIIVPELELYDERILSVEVMLSNKCIQNVRTGDLNNTNRKFILLRLLIQLLGNGEFQEQLLTCCAASVSENVEGDKSAPMMMARSRKVLRLVTVLLRLLIIIFLPIIPYLLRKARRKTRKEQKAIKLLRRALKELGCFGDFSFDSSTPRGYNTQNGGEINGDIGGKPNSASTTAEGKGTSKGGGVKKAPLKEKVPRATAKEKPQYSKRPVSSLKNQKGKGEDYEVQDVDDYGEHNGYGAKIPANHFDPAQFQHTQKWRRNELVWNVVDNSLSTTFKKSAMRACFCPIIVLNVVHNLAMKVMYSSMVYLYNANHVDTTRCVATFGWQTIEKNAAKAAAQVATADLRRAHEVELKRMQEELRR
jgi:hypothetical protein